MNDGTAPLELAIEELCGTMEHLSEKDSIEAVVGIGVNAHAADELVVVAARAGGVGVDGRWG